MNSSLFTADRMTHLKIVVVALVAATVVAAVSVSARWSNYENGQSIQASAPVMKAGQPVTAAGTARTAIR